MSGARTVTRVCPLCEATCGLLITVGDAADDAPVVTRVRGNPADVLSHGYVCPKGVALADLHADPDRLRAPLVRRGDEHVEVGWDDALAEVERVLRPVYAAHGPTAVGAYLGNPNVHSLASAFFLPAALRALRIGSVFSASTVDQMPKQVAAGLMFGTPQSVPVPDVDRSAYLLVLGGNPLVSNGSLWTAPDLPGRLRAMRARGGRLVVVDPVRTRTADAADEHVSIRPGTDVLLLASLVREVLGGPVDLGAATVHVDPQDVSRLGAAVAGFDPDVVARPTGVPGATIRRIAADLRAAPAAAVYGRLGTTTAALAAPDGQLHAFGTVSSWLVDVLNVVTGNVDRPGGAMWPLPAVGSANTQGSPGRGRGLRVPGSRATRVRRLPGVLGELPAVALAEEIDTPSPDGSRLRALLTVAGNPVLTVPGGPRLARALASLDAMVSVDAYLNETTRHAHVVLPAPSPLTRPHHDPAFAIFSVRNVVRYDEPVVPLGPQERSEAETLLWLAAFGTALATGGPVVDVDAADAAVAGLLAARLAADESSRAHGVEPAELLTAVAHRRREARIMDLLLRAGPYGDGFGRHPGGLTLDAVLDQPSGVDLGPLRPRLPEVLRTPSGRIDLAPAVLLAELARVGDVLDRLAESPAADGAAGPLLLVGRRQVRGNNSWMHNLPSLAGGSTRCTVLVHPDDARAAGVEDGQPAQVVACPGAAGAAGAAAEAPHIDVIVEVSDRVAAGVVSVPHGWGHTHQGGPPVRLGVATADPGGNVNALTPDVVDPLASTAVLNGVPVRLAPVPA